MSPNMAQITPTNKPTTPDSQDVYPRDVDVNELAAKSRFWHEYNHVPYGEDEIDGGTNIELWLKHDDVRARGMIWREFHEWQQDPVKTSGGISSSGFHPAIKYEELSEQSEDDAEEEDEKEVPSATQSLMRALPPYKNDPAFNSELACRSYTAYDDPEDTQRLIIPGDDWQLVVKTGIEDWTRKVYASTACGYSLTFPPEARFRAHKMLKYIEQQDKATRDLIALVATPTQVKAARANCRLLVYAAIHVSQVGVNKKAYDRYQQLLKGGKQISREAHIDITSICSVRLAKIIAAIASNKLIARDVMEGKNLNLFARDPDFYIVTKLFYLSSNSTRGVTAKMEKAVAAAGQEGDKETKLPTGGVKREAEEEDVGDLDDTYQPPRLTKRVKRN